MAMEPKAPAAVGLLGLEKSASSRNMERASLANKKYHNLTPPARSTDLDSYWRPVRKLSSVRKKLLSKLSFLKGDVSL